MSITEKSRWSNERAAQAREDLEHRLLEMGGTAEGVRGMDIFALKEAVSKAERTAMMGSADVDADLERRIDLAGRERVFERASALGWSIQSPPPKWVWQQIVDDLNNLVPAPQDPRSMQEQVLSFSIL